MSKALVEAARIGDLAKVNKLLQDPNTNSTYNDNEPLRKAAGNGHLAVVERLLQIKAVEEDAHAYNNGALREAAQGGYLDVVMRLLRIKKVRESAHLYDNSVLYGAVFHGHIDVVLELLQLDKIKDNIDAKNHQALKAAISLLHSEDVAKAIVYVLCKVYEALSKELPRDIKFVGKILSEFVKNYEAELDTVKEVSRGKFDERGISGIIEEYTLLLDSDELAKRRVVQEKADRYAELGKEAKVNMEKAGTSRNNPLLSSYKQSYNPFLTAEEKTFLSHITELKKAIEKAEDKAVIEKFILEAVDFLRKNTDKIGFDKAIWESLTFKDMLRSLPEQHTREITSLLPRSKP